MCFSVPCHMCAGPLCPPSLARWKLPDALLGAACHLWPACRSPYLSLDLDPGSSRCDHARGTDLRGPRRELLFLPPARCCTGTRLSFWLRCVWLRRVKLAVWVSSLARPARLGRPGCGFLKWRPRLNQLLAASMKGQGQSLPQEVPQNTYHLLALSSLLHLVNVSRFTSFSVGCPSIDYCYAQPFSGQILLLPTLTQLLFVFFSLLGLARHPLHQQRVRSLPSTAPPSSWSASLGCNSVSLYRFLSRKSPWSDRQNVPRGMVWTRSSPRSHSKEHVDFTRRFSRFQCQGESAPPSIRTLRSTSPDHPGSRNTLVTMSWIQLAWGMEKSSVYHAERSSLL